MADRHVHPDGTTPSEATERVCRSAPVGTFCRLLPMTHKVTASTCVLRQLKENGISRGRFRRGVTYPNHS